MIHQVLGGAEGKASDIKIQAERILKMKKKINNLLSELTGKSVKKINKDTEKDYYMNPEAAIKYGIIDKIVEKVKDNKKDSYKDIFMSYDKKNSDKLIYIYEELKKFSVL